MPTVPEASDDVVMVGAVPVGAGALIVIESDLVVEPALLDACAVKLLVPAVVGVPVIAPEEFRDSPAGSEPPAELQVIGVVPEADSVCE